MTVMENDETVKFYVKKYSNLGTGIEVDFKTVEGTAKPNVRYVT